MASTGPSDAHAWPSKEDQHLLKNTSNQVAGGTLSEADPSGVESVIVPPSSDNERAVAGTQQGQQGSSQSRSVTGKSQQKTHRNRESEPPKGLPAKSLKCGAGGAGKGQVNPTNHNVDKTQKPLVTLPIPVVLKPRPKVMFTP